MIFRNIVLVLILSRCAAAPPPASHSPPPSPPRLSGILLSARPIQPATPRGAVLLALGRPPAAGAAARTEVTIRLQDGRLVTLVAPTAPRPGYPVSLLLSPTGAALAP